VHTLPSVPSGQEHGIELKPFRGVRYVAGRVSAIANTTSPPYDVIGPGVLDDLLAADPHNIVRLILPGPETGGPPGADGASLAAGLLREWLGSGVLVRESAPSFYIYEQNAPGWLQRGLLALVRVGTPAEAGILPHERVMPGPVAGRRELMRATRANLEPIFLVYNGGGSDGRGGSDGFPAGADGSDGFGAGADGSGGHGGVAGTASALVNRVAAEQPPLMTTVTRDGVTHRLWRVDDPAVQAAVAADLATRPARIADGHHRYAAYRQLRDQMRAAGHGTGPWDYGLAFLVDADAYPPRLGAIHRVLRDLPADTAARRAGEAFRVRAAGEDFGAALAALADAGREGHAFLLAGDGGFRLLDRPSAGLLTSAMPSEVSDEWRSLDAAVLQEVLLAKVWGIEDNVRDVLISHDAEEAVRMARAASGTAVICNPMPITAVQEIAALGECVPRKSTSFGPKPRTGLVFRTFEE
jgi:uncharacterized protein (DUF1015 family)